MKGARFHQGAAANLRNKNPKQRRILNKVIDAAIDLKLANHPPQLFITDISPIRVMSNNNSLFSQI
jgi:hypothetical protein